MVGPTEILVKQYARSLGPLLDRLGVSWRLLTSTTPTDEKERTLQALAEGQVSICFGTHVVFEPSVQSADCSFVCFDEQQRFGVEQREALLAKASWCRCPFDERNTHPAFACPCALWHNGDQLSAQTTADQELPHYYGAPFHRRGSRRTMRCAQPFHVASRLLVCPLSRYTPPKICLRAMKRRAKMSRSNMRSSNSVSNPMLSTPKPQVVGKLSGSRLPSNMPRSSRAKCFLQHAWPFFMDDLLLKRRARPWKRSAQERSMCSFRPRLSKWASMFPMPRS